LLKEAGAAGLGFELLNRDLDQPFKYLGTWLVDQWSKVGLNVRQRILPVGPWFEAMRDGSFDVTVEGNCQSVVNPLLDVQKYLPRSVYTENYGGFDDPNEVDLYQRMLHETDPVKQRAIMCEFEKYVLGEKAHELFLLWQHRIVPYRSYLKGWRAGPSFYVSQDLATIWLDR
jgi:peptide/nickel transport system substrate-binding protein